MSIREYLTEKIDNFFLGDKKTKKQMGKMSQNSTKTSEVEQIENVDATTTFDPFNIFVNSFQVDLSNESLIKKWRQISRYPEVSVAIDEIVNEAIVMEEDGEVVKLDLVSVELPDNLKQTIIKRFDKILNLIDFDKNADKIFKKFYVDGVIVAELIFDKHSFKKGVVEIEFLTPINFTKVKNIRNGEVFYGYKGQDSSNRANSITGRVTNINSLSSSTDEQLMQKFYEEQIALGVSGIYNEDKDIYTSYLDDCVRVVNQIYTIEDALIIYRLTRSTEKRAFYIDVSGMNKTRAEQYIQSLMLKFKQRKVYDQDSGSLVNKKKTVSILEDFWFPTRSDAKGTRVETLQGSGDTMGQLDDLNYFVEKLYLALKVPRMRLNKDYTMRLDGGFSEIEREEIKFTKFVKKQRRQFNYFLLDILKKDLISAKILKLDDWNKIKNNIKLIYSTDNHYTEAKELQLLEKRLGIISSMSDFLPETGKTYFSNKYVRNHLLKHTEEEMQEFDKQIKIEGGDVIDYSVNMNSKGEKSTTEHDVRDEIDDEGETVETTKNDKVEKTDKEIKTESVLTEKNDPDNILEYDRFISELIEGDEIQIGNQKFVVENGEIIAK